MKRLLTMALMAFVLLALVACGSNGNGGGSSADEPMFHRLWDIVAIEQEGTIEEVRDIFENFDIVVLDIEADDSGTQSVFQVEFEFNPGDLDIADYLASLEDELYTNGYERWQIVLPNYQTAELVRLMPIAYIG